MNLSCENKEAILIDNKRENLAAWASRGGAVYLYTDDDRFSRDVADGIDALAGCS